MSARAYEKIRVSGLGDGAGDGLSVCTLTLSNPARKNAIGPQMVNELLYALDDAFAAPAVRSVVITGEGNAFCAGGDFAQMTAGGAESALPPKGDYADLLLKLCRSPKPTIARVNGPAMGGGLGIVASCTFAVAQSDATLGTPEVNVGLFPMMIMAVLARLVPRRRLMEMMLFGDKLGADAALSLGLLSRVVPAAELDAAVAELTHKVAQKSPSTLRHGLEAFAAQDDLDLEAALPLLRDRLAAVLSTDDAREGLMAFLEKRTPTWTGK